MRYYVPPDERGDKRERGDDERRKETEKKEKHEYDCRDDCEEEFEKIKNSNPSGLSKKMMPGSVMMCPPSVRTPSICAASFAEVSAGSV